MILGTGIDIIEVSRVADVMERFGERFVRRILLPPEIEYCRSHAHPARHIAARFAAKEAISKAFGTGIGSQLGWLDMEIERRPSGQPVVRLHAKGLVLLETLGGTRVHISLSHTDVSATAVAILEGDLPNAATAE